MTGHWDQDAPWAQGKQRPSPEGLHAEKLREDRDRWIDLATRRAAQGAYVTLEFQTLESRHRRALELLAEAATAYHLQGFALPEGWMERFENLVAESNDA